MSETHLDRRRMLTGLGSVGSFIVAGCAGSGDGQTTTSTATTTTRTTETTETKTETTTENSTELDPTIEVPDAALQDEPIQIELVGVEPGTDVTLHALTKYPEGGRYSGQYESYAQFTASEDGTVEVADQQPAAGTYDEAEAMGLFWSMYSRSEIASPSETELQSPTAESDGRTVHLEATVDDTIVASAQTRRRAASPGIETRDPPGDLFGRLYLPAESGPHPGAILLHGGSANLPAEPARLLASRGIAAFALRYLGSESALPSGPVHIPLEYFGQAAEWLDSQEEVRAGGVGIGGLSLGGAGSLAAATKFDLIDAVVATAGSSLAFGGETTKGKSPWSFDGEPLPFVQVTYDDAVKEDGLVVSRPVFEAGLERASQSEIEAAMFPLEDASADFLFITGLDDQIWPASDLAERAVNRLDDAGYDRSYEHIAYEDAGHLIGSPYGVTTKQMAGGNRLQGGTSAGIAHAEADSWPKLIETFRGVGHD